MFRLLRRAPFQVVQDKNCSIFSTIRCHELELSLPCSIAHLANISGDIDSTFTDKEVQMFRSQALVLDLCMSFQSYGTFPSYYYYNFKCRVVYMTGSRATASFDFAIRMETQVVRGCLVGSSRISLSLQCPSICFLEGAVEDILAHPTNHPQRHWHWH